MQVRAFFRVRSEQGIWDTDREQQALRNRHCGRLQTPLSVSIRLWKWNKLLFDIFMSTSQNQSSENDDNEREERQRNARCKPLHVNKVLAAKDGGRRRANPPKADFREAVAAHLGGPRRKEQKPNHDQKSN